MQYSSAVLAVQFQSLLEGEVIQDRRDALELLEEGDCRWHLVGLLCLGGHQLVAPDHQHLALQEPLEVLLRERDREGVVDEVVGVGLVLEGLGRILGVLVARLDRREGLAVLREALAGVPVLVPVRTASYDTTLGGSPVHVSRTLCGRVSGKSTDGNNAEPQDHFVDCKLCKAIMANPKHPLHRRFLAPK
jgi:hypothetical protein